MPRSPQEFRTSSVLADHIRQQSEKTRALDGARELALLFSRYCGDAARHHFAALGNIALQKLDVLVIDLGRVGAGERAALTAAKERAARAGARLHETHARSSVAS